MLPVIKVATAASTSCAVVGGVTQPAAIVRSVLIAVSRPSAAGLVRRRSHVRTWRVAECRTGQPPSAPPGAQWRQGRSRSRIPAHSYSVAESVAGGSGWENVQVLGGQDVGPATTWVISKGACGPGLDDVVVRRTKRRECGQVRIGR